MPINDDELKIFLAKKCEEFDDKLLRKIQGLDLSIIMKRKNPYVYMAEGITRSQDLVKEMVSDYVSSSKETIFGEVLEDIARFLLDKLYDGIKSGRENVDLEAIIGLFYYIMQIKSGPNWGNASQIKKMAKDLYAAGQAVKTENPTILLNGCCYGNDNRSCNVKDDNIIIRYEKKCGQEFWKLITNDNEFYIKLGNMLADINMSKDKQAFINSYNETIEKMTTSFIGKFTNDDGTINWKEFLEFNSGRKLNTRSNNINNNLVLNLDDK